MADDCKVKFTIDGGVMVCDPSYLKMCSGEEAAGRANEEVIVLLFILS